MAERVEVAPAPGTRELHNVEIAEAYVEALLAQGVSYLFLNPGTDTFPIQEAIAKRRALGQPAPEVVLCPFEVPALAAAHGYYAVSGRPQTVLVHVDVGTQNLGAMVHNAQRGRAAVLLSAGRAPYTTDPSVRGTRDGYIHWLQEQLDQHGIVRNYVKWDYELRRPDQVGEVVTRAYQIAESDPPGPVYLTLPREVIMERVERVRIPDPRRFPSTRLGAGDPDLLRQAAELLVRAERPLVLTAASGRSRAGWDGLIELAELLALPVVEWRTRANFPADHPLHQGYNYGLEHGLAEADVVLILDHDVPYIPTRTPLPADTTVIQIDLDPVKERIPLWSFPVDLPIRADTGAALPALAAAARDLLTEADRRRIEERRQRLAAASAARRAEWRQRAAAQSTTRPITVEWLGYCLEEFRCENPDLLVIDEAITSQVPLFCQIQSTTYGSWYQSGGSGLGWGLGAAIGAKLAAPDRTVLGLIGDGSFLFGVPEASLWIARQAKAPILIVIVNNACYNATKRPLVAAYPEGYSVKTGEFIGIELAPTPRFDLLAQSVDAYGERVEEPDQILPALRRALAHVRDGQSAVLDVILARP